VYDPEKWAVVFKYSSVSIASGKTVQFINHPSGAPVVWLAQSNITIAGTVDLAGVNANNGRAGSFTNGGPGGFAGGRGYLISNNTGSAGLGPGGGGHTATASGSGGYAFPGAGTLPGGAYGNPRIVPLIGGSGGGGSSSQSFGGGGGGGGGAILLACAGTASLSGTVNANGGNGYTSVYAWYSPAGSGGGIRIIANEVTGAASALSVLGGTGNASGSVGRIRIEANAITLTGSSSPDYTWLKPLDNDTAVLWLPDNAPRIRVVTVGTESVPVDPGNRFNPPGDVVMVTTDPQPVMMEANNVPTTWLVKLRVTQRNGASSTIDAALVSGDELSSTWQATLTGVPINDFVIVQARATGL
jgi:hypothetical protein